MKSTVYCYDRFATLKRAALMAALCAAAGALAMSVGASAQAATLKIERLPTVVITGKSVKPVQLQRVVVEGRRAQPATELAAAPARVAELRQVAYAPTSAGN